MTERPAPSPQAAPAALAAAAPPRPSLPSTPVAATGSAATTETGGNKSSVVISHIEYDGKAGRSEADEYIEIRNQGSLPVDISGWRVSAGNVGQDFHFPSATVIKPQQILRVYTNEVHPETGGFSFGSVRAIWNNRGDIGLLFDRSGAEVSRWAYGRKPQAKAPAQVPAPPKAPPMGKTK
jgi:hypothetical protein